MFAYFIDTVDEIDPVFAKTSQYARFLLSENERFRLVFVKTVSINSGTGKVYYHFLMSLIDLQQLAICH
jgi:hypothetical protein